MFAGKFRVFHKALTGKYLDAPTCSIWMPPLDERRNVPRKFSEIDREHARACGCNNQDAYLKFFVPGTSLPP